MAVKVNDLKVGHIIQEDNALWQIVEIDHVKPGKGPAYLQIKKKSLDSGRLINDRYNSGKPVDLAQVDNRKLEYGWPEEAGHVFMDPETFEQVTISGELLDPILGYLKSNQSAQVKFHGPRAIAIDLPGNVELEIVDTDPGIKGDSVSNVFKPARLETGIQIKVPLHIEPGNIVKVNTSTGEFSGRVNR